MRNPFWKHWDHFWTRERKRSLYEGIALLAVAIIVQVFRRAIFVARCRSARNSVSDVLLDNLPVVNLDFHDRGRCDCALGDRLVAAYRRSQAHLIFGTKAIALFIISRAFFFSLTHVGPPASGIPPGPQNLGWGFYKLLTFQGNFFYSGHTGFPVLMALIFWDDDFWRPFFHRHGGSFWRERPACPCPLFDRCFRSALHRLRRL
jgi:hypothetical protein